MMLRVGGTARHHTPGCCASLYSLGPWAFGPCHSRGARGAWACRRLVQATSAGPAASTQLCIGLGLQLTAPLLMPVAAVPALLPTAPRSTFR